MCEHDIKIGYSFQLKKDIEYCSKCDLIVEVLLK